MTDNVKPLKRPLGDGVSLDYSKMNPEYTMYINILLGLGHSLEEAQRMQDESFKTPGQEPANDDA